MMLQYGCRWIVALCCALGLGALLGGTAHAQHPVYGPVCSNAQYLGDNGLSPPGQEWITRHIYYCPQGAKVIQFVFAGAYANGTPPREYNLTDPQVIDLSVETYVAPPWNPATQYAAGDRVSAPPTATDGGGSFVALVPNVNNLPTSSNVGVWQMIPPPTPIPITCNGVRPCILGATTNAAGQSVTNPFLFTDPLPVNIPPGTLIAIRGAIRQSGAQVLAEGPMQTIRAGTYQFFAPAMPDLTMAGTAVAGGSDSNTGPFAIIGVQNVAKPVPSVCVIGDSRIEGVAGFGMTWAPIYSGGQGYVADDIGRLVVNIDTGGTPEDAVYGQQTIYVIQNVAGGKVTQAGVYFPGHYGVPKDSTVPGARTALPVGPQPTVPLHGTTGSGLMINIIPNRGMSQAAGLYEDPKTFAQGLVQTGLSHAGIPFASFARSSDAIRNWGAPGGDTNRLAAIQRAGCTSVIMGYGLIDTNAGELPAATESRFVAVATQLYNLGTVKAVYLATIEPQTSSTDHWTTVAGQVPIGWEAHRQALNTWERSVPIPFAGTFDTAAAVEVNQANVPTINGGYWMVDGTPFFPTVDATHLSPGTAVLAAGVITAGAATLK